MENKYIVAISVVLVFIVGLIVYRQTKRQAAFDEDSKKQGSIMVAMAKTSPIGGLTQMGMSLKRYEQENGRFPHTLDQLYPKYVSHRAFIDEVPWVYTAEAHEFLLKKRFTMKGRRMIVSVDKTLIPRIRTGLMVASVGGVSEGVGPGQPETGGGSKTPVSGKVTSTGAKGKRFQALLKQPMPAQPVGLPKEETKFLSEPVPEPFSILGDEECTGFPLDVSQQHLVWKDKEGVIGFGNVEYPGVERMAILADGKWVSVERVRPETQESDKPAYTSLQTPRTFFGMEVR
ncbi:MAG: hypothetical protein JRI70_08525 [Deltaproteobacteria bacterium]|nr:hypothetical protein [Deltaproteobacteria bacterium]